MIQQTCHISLKYSPRQGETMRIETEINDGAAAPAITSLHLEFCTGFGQFDTRKNSLENYQGITGKEIVAMLRNPPSVPKDQAQWFIPSTYKASDGRVFEVQRDRGEFWFLPLDEDDEAENNLSFDDMDKAVVKVCGAAGRLIYSTRSSTPERRKWRALIPLQHPLSGRDYADTVAAFNAALIEASEGVLIPDTALEREAQLIYLPNRGEFYQGDFMKGDRLDLTPDHQIIERRERIRTERREAEEAARARRERKRDEALANPGGNASIIEAFNGNTTVGDELARYGYIMSRNGRDWRSPNSSTGSYAVHDYGDFWTSFSGSDAALKIGNVSKKGTLIGDAFDLFVHYDHGGDFTAAVRAYATEIGEDHKSRQAKDMANVLSDFPPPAPTQGEQAKQKPKAGFHLVRADHLEFKEPEFLIEGLIEAETLGLLFADPASGKSFVALDMGASIATGNGFHGRETKQGAVIYICGEGKNGIKRRLIAWERHHGVSLNGAPLFASSVAARFLSPESIKEIVVAIDGAAQEAGSVAMIIIDTLNRNMGAGDESSTADMTEFISAVDAVKDRYEASALVVHHTGHGNKERARGSMALLGALDSEYRIQKDESIVTMTCTKMKDAACPSPIAFELEDIEVGRNRKGEAIISAALTETEAPETRAPRLSGNQQIAMEALQQFISDHGKPNPGGTGWPERGSVKCAETEAFTAFLRDKMASDNPDNRRRIAQRALKDLIEKRKVQINAGCVWII